MINRLCIRNYALIEQVDIAFSERLSIITGETGAGKSIILGALGLLLGERADSKSLFKNDSKCVIEGTFNITAYKLQEYFAAHDIDYAPETIIRREITVDGRSRAFVNDTPVNLTLLKSLGLQLIDIHSQHQTLQINQSSFQLQVIDGFAQHKVHVSAYRKQFNAYKRNHSLLEALIAESAAGKAEFDYLKFQFDELEQANLKADEQQVLEQEQKVLSHADEIKNSLSTAAYLLEQGDTPLLSQLKDTVQAVAALEKYDPALRQLVERLNSVHIELKDITLEIENIAENSSVDPARLQIINERLDLIYRLQQKHRLDSVSELLSHQETLDERLSGISNLDEDIQNLQQEMEKQHADLVQEAKVLSAERIKAITAVEIQVTALLRELALPNARFVIENTVLSEEKLGINGLDQIRFLFSANQGFAPQDLGKVASGGELSRLMLAIKGLSAKYNALPTIIFDEIDTGVSGEVARKVGNVMHNYADNMQVITITHLPQIAGKGEAHFFVYKEIKENRTSTNIKRLSKEERIQEIATMLSGDKPGKSAIMNAKELLNY